MEDIHAIWGHRWVSPKAISKDSGRHGLGVFASEKILAGELIAILGGVIVPKKDIRSYWERMTHVGIQIHDDFFIVPTSRDELKKFGVFNHSCSPNIGFQDSIQLIAIRDIKEGEELAFDYAFNETVFDSFECKCGSENCRQTVTNTDWQNKDIQKKYSKYYSPYLKNKILMLL